MAVLERTIHDLSYADRRATLLRALEQQDEHMAAALLSGYADLAVGAVAARDLEAIARLRAQIARLMRRIPQSHETGVAPAALQQLEWVDGVLDRGRVAVLLQRTAQEREEAAGPLRERIVRLLEEKALRPRELAEQLGCDPSQISRALRELQQEQVVMRVDGAQAGGDRRGIWYQQTESTTAA